MTRNDDHAGRRAREVVGLYGDPETTWGIAAEFGVRPALERGDVEHRLGELQAAWPHLGPAIQVEEVPGELWDEMRSVLVAAPFRPGTPLLRIALEKPVATGQDLRRGAESEVGRLLVVAHHGVCDGLGLVAVAAALVPGHVVSRALGIGDRSATGSFLGSGLRRLGEALLHPPPRFDRRPGSGGAEHLRLLILGRRPTGTAHLCVGVGAVFAEWNRITGSPRPAPLVVVGASRRRAGELAPDRKTAYFRLRVPLTGTVGEMRARLRQQAPEPDFPETSVGGMGPKVTRLLRRRLGATAQISNLGVIEAGVLRHVAMFPALAGPDAVAVGLASTEETTTLTLRTRDADFDGASTEELLQRLAQALEHTP